MNQTDYRKIAEIIKRRIKALNKDKSVLILKGLSLELADYFKKEDNEIPIETIQNPNFEGFNRKQFLKDCWDEGR